MRARIPACGVRARGGWGEGAKIDERVVPPILNNLAGGRNIVLEERGMGGRSED